MKFVKDIADVLVEQHHALHSNLSDDPNYNTRTTFTDNTNSPKNKSIGEQENNKTNSSNCNDDTKINTLM